MHPADLIGKGLRNEIREFYVGRTLHQISLDFEEAGLSADTAYDPPTSGARRSYVEQFYHRIDWGSASDVNKFLLVVELVLEHLESEIRLFPNPDQAKATLARLNRLFSRAGIVQKAGRLSLPLASSAITAVSTSSKRLEAPDLHRQLERLSASAEADPALAIGTAKELVETVCRAILEESSVAVDHDWDITRLVRETRDVLVLLPDQIPDKAKGVEVIRKLLGQLGAVSQSLGELRNLYGTGHGRRSSSAGLAARHARLAVGAAATLVTFLLDTHWERVAGREPK